MTTANREKRRRLMALTEIRAERLRRALTLFEVAQAAGISTYRVSCIERGVDDGTPEELHLMRAAIEKLARERDGESA
jgi:transcriptional regulator with XRE-family HTH domain